MPDSAIVASHGEPLSRPDCDQLASCHACCDRYSTDEGAQNPGTRSAMGSVEEDWNESKVGVNAAPRPPVDSYMVVRASIDSFHCDLQLFLII